MLTVPLPPLEDAVRRLAAVPMPCGGSYMKIRCAHERCLDSRLATAWLDFTTLRDTHEAAFANTLQMYRQRADLKQSALAAETGIGEKTLSTFETGARVRSITFDQLRLILAACGGDLETFYRDVRAW